jgi:hypothetical protein
MELFQWLTDNYYQPHICQILLIILLLQCHNSIPNLCHYLHRLAILLPERSPWKKLYENANAESFLHMTGLTHGASASFLITSLTLMISSIIADADGLFH